MHILYVLNIFFLSRMKRHVCQKCPKSYHTKRELVTHEKTVHLRKMDFLCENCSAVFVDQLSLKRHSANMHNSSKKFYCNICKRGFGVRSHLNEHVNTVHGKNLKKSCEICHKILRSKRSLRIHIMSKHNREECEHQCICLKKFSTSTLLKRHLKNVHEDLKDVHGDDEPLFKNQASIISERKINDQMKPAPTSNRELRMDSHDDEVEEMFLVELEQLEKPIPIQEKQAIISRKSPLNVENHRHNSGKKRIRLRTLPGRHNCENCAMVFSHKYLLTLHMQRVHHLNSKISLHNKSITENNLVRYYQCSYCSKSLSHRNSVRRHEISHEKNQVAGKNNNNRAKIFACDKCEDKKYSRVEHLTRHQRIIHEGIQAGQCHFCDNRVFKDLPRHMVMIHSPANQTKAGKNCYSKSNFICDLCNNRSRRFKTHRSLLHHRKRNHEGASSNNLTKRKMFSCHSGVRGPS